MADLRRFARRYITRRDKLERELADLRAERDEAIRTAAAAGVPVVEIAAVLELNHQRVSQILRGE